MARTVTAGVSTAPSLKREDCKRTEHDSAFSQWKILIGPCDWEDYLLNKEGAERYRTHNLPNCASCPGLYELGIAVLLPQKEGKTSSKLSSDQIIPVYVGQADDVRIRLQQYGRDGAHLANGLFSNIFSYGVAVAFRWAPMESKKDAERAESQFLKTFDYAWNRGMNGERRPDDIYRKLDGFPPKKVGLTIKWCDSPVLENGFSFYPKQETPTFLSGIFKLSRSRPTLVPNECNMNTIDVICGVALGHGSICTRPPVEGRERCLDHKGMKITSFVSPRSLTNTEDIPHSICGVTLDDASLCTRIPVAGRKRCEEHKGMRVDTFIPLSIAVQEKHGLPSSGFDTEIRSFCSKVKSCEEHKGMMVNGNKSKVLNREYSSYTSTTSLTCAAITLDGSLCKRKPGAYSKFCGQHEARMTSSDTSAASLTRAAITLDGSSCKRKPGEYSKFCWQQEARMTSSYTSAASLTCAAITRHGSSCKRKPGPYSMFCWQHVKGNQVHIACFAGNMTKIDR